MDLSTIISFIFLPFSDFQFSVNISAYVVLGGGGFWLGKIREIGGKVIWEGWFVVGPTSGEVTRGLVWG